jgi:hypothetical protein
MERLSAMRGDTSAKPAPQYSDAKLVREREALESAWRYEVAALMVMKRLNTVEAAAIAKAARAATAMVVKRIETARAMTLEGLNVKARAILWRRHGEPLEADARDDLDFRGAQTESSISRDR